MSRKSTNVAVQASHYSIGNFLSLVAGFVTFPILTRVLSTEDYGTMSLVSLVLTLLVGTGKLGMQHSIVRFSHEIRVGKYGEETLVRFHGTVFDGFLGSALAFSFLWIFLAHLAIPKYSFLPSHSRWLLLIVMALIAIRIMESPFISILRAQEYTRAVNVYTVLKRYGSLVTVVVLVGVFVHTVTAFFTAIAISESASLFVLGLWFVLNQPVSLQAFSPRLLQAMLAFGLPMALTELSYTIFSSGDRYVIQALIGSKAVGIYSAAYNLCDYLQTTLLTAILAAVQPVLVRIYEEHGVSRTASFMRQSMHSYVLIAAPMVAGFSAIAGPALAILASQRYTGAAMLTPWIVGGMALGGFSSLASCGLYIKKKATVTLLLIVASATLNIAMNLYLVPIDGIRGSAIATLLSYAMLGTASYLAALRYLVVPLPWAASARAIACSLVMYFAINWITFDHNLATLLVRTIVGAIVYGALVFTFDSFARNWMIRIGGHGSKRLASAFRNDATDSAMTIPSPTTKSGVDSGGTP